MGPEVFSVSEVTDYIKRLLSRDHSLSDLWIKGEISNFYHHNSGHMYFTIKDKDAQISAVMFKGNNRNLKMDPEEGMEITAHGYVDVYKPRGEYQFYVQEMKPGGKGALYQAFEELKQRLEKEGLFDPEHKQEIPALPGRIGVVTSPNGAAIRDIISVAERRFDNVSLLIVPSLVQGERAAGQIVEGIEYLNSRKEEFDLIIVSRGGGSIEDLWPFNEEEVARAIYRSELPIISGVGHETDFTIADFVSDLRAPTPSAAAEMAVSSRLELEKELKNLSSRLGRTTENTLKNCRQRLNNVTRKRILRNPEQIFLEDIQRLDELGRRLGWNLQNTLNRKQERYNLLKGKLDTLSPLKTLKRGYSISQLLDDGVVERVAQVAPGDKLETRLQDGRIISLVQQIKEDGDIDD